MRVGKSSDTSTLTWVGALSDELLPVFEKMEQQYAVCEIELFFVFRCLPDTYERNSRVRYAKAENVLYFDIVTSEDEYKTLTKNRQRYELSHAFYAFFREKLKKYKVQGLDYNQFMSDIKHWLQEIGWLQTELESYMTDT
ncbi:MULTISPECIES: hypothetical protein [Paenibacillus]|uniref:hypothetical protein n=1 Tax=Paenibacillus TaxID=44249 RepID=UPI000FE2797B|nr:MULTISPECIES: hypothetical protein [Paenibacillus]